MQVVRAEEPQEIEAKVEGTPLGIVGRLSATSLTTLTEVGDETKINYEVEAALAGKLGSLGQPVLRTKAKEMERQFAARLAAAFATPAAPRHTGAARARSVETDVLVIGSGAAGMYAAIEASRGGAQVLLADRSLIGRGGATVMAQMTVAAALGEETPDDPQTSLCQHHRRRPRTMRRKARALLCEDAPECIREMDSLGRRLGAQGRPHHRDHGSGPRPAALRLRRFHQYRAGGVEDAAHATGAQSELSAKPAIFASSILSSAAAKCTGAVAYHLGPARRSLSPPRRRCWRPAG